MIRGWCPGAMQPMRSGDGLIVRLRVTGGILGARLATDIAQWSRRWGNGQIDLSNRGNLQLRGLSAENLGALQDAVADAGLLDTDPAAEAVRNVIASPLAGIDPTAVLDIRQVVARLEERLAGDRALHALPGKFGFAVDDGGRFGLGGVPADVWFVAGHGSMFSVRLAGPSGVIGACSAEAVPDVAAAVGRGFLRQPGARRMRDVAAGEIADVAGPGPEIGPREPDPFLGVHALGGLSGKLGAFVGAGVPFGRISADDLDRLAAVGPELRLTPWRAVLIPMPALAEARALAAQLAADGFILNETDPRRRVAACPGAPACGEASTPTRADAAALAACLPAGGFLHVSGCAKGCAHPGAAPVTLVGRAGRYDLVHDGPAGAVPAIRGLTLGQIREHLR